MVDYYFYFRQFHCAALRHVEQACLELTEITCLCFWLPSAGIKGVYYHILP